MDRRNIEVIEQAFIALTELIAIWLLQSKTSQYRKWASIFGLLGQPFWFYASYQASQWGAFTLCFFFTLAWLKSLNDYWLVKKQTISNEDYYQLISDALENTQNTTKLDCKDYIRRVLKEALKIE
jgi:hypothetical protein